MGRGTYFIISLILFGNLFLSPVSVATGEVDRKPNDETDSKLPDPYRDTYYGPRCPTLSRRQDYCGPPINSPKP